ncbi:AMP-binding protein [Dermabacter hominis]|uniref:AMP-binding protein n=1 Tax=Dermabacter hominis TaxID=36740 RepID=UPI0021A7D779|nr:AMP-binding protein [Dermabacter hominis]MCT1717305.1 AMP-binding protein [Dermabacter hominis]MCT1790563.1 AMP-binding protein [Dermabacter hominis]MCT1956336.1 AMP-binding protein [Dermabacter hominis]
MSTSHTPDRESLPWLTPGPFDGTVCSQAQYARGIGEALAGTARLWLGAHERPELIGPLECTKPRENACAGCTCARSNAGVREPDPREIALVVPTSGSTGTPKSVAHSIQSLKASIHATAYELGSHGAWMLFLPPMHIAGVQVIARASVASTLLGLDDHDGLPGALAPLVDLSGHFDATVLTGAMERWDARVRSDQALADLPLYTSFVPTQLERIVSAAEAGDAAVSRALSRFEMILVGGAATAPELLDRARKLGARIVTTYGSSETAGGCVYNGLPLQGVELKVNDEDQLMITGPSIALGYIYETGAFTNVDGNDADSRRRFFSTPELAATRLLRTSDLARLTRDKATGLTRLTILGRADDVIISGGRKIVPQALERVLEGTGEFREVLVVPVESKEWGQMAVALTVPKVEGAMPTQTWTADLQAQLTVATTLTDAGFARHEIPRSVLTTGALPRLDSGKVDRKAASELAHEALLNIEAFEYAKSLGTRFSTDGHHELEFGGPDEEDNE